MWCYLKNKRVIDTGLLSIGIFTFLWKNGTRMRKGTTNIKVNDLFSAYNYVKAEPTTASGFIR